MGAVDTASSKASQRSKQSSFDVKATLAQLTAASKKWSKADSTANGFLYGLLGEIYEAIHNIKDDKAAEKTLRAACAKTGFKSKEVPALLITHTIGKEDNASKRSQWKKRVG